MSVLDPGVGLLPSGGADEGLQGGEAPCSRPKHFPHHTTRPPVVALVHDGGVEGPQSEEVIQMHKQGQDTRDVPVVTQAIGRKQREAYMGLEERGRGGGKRQDPRAVQSINQSIRFALGVARP